MVSPVDFEKVGDGQSARIGREIAMPLRMRIINETGGVVPFPSVVWSVVEGEATLITASDPDGALARVVMGETPGPVVVRGVLGSLAATFNLTATAPQPVSISTVSGQNQILAAGEISDPLIVQLNEVGDQPASSVDVTFSGPDFVVLHPLSLGNPGNPLIQRTGADGRTGVRVELPVTAAALMEASGRSDQFARTISIVATPGGALSTTFVLGTIGRPPAFEPGGLVNAATFQPGIVPGSLATLVRGGPVGRDHRDGTCRRRHVFQRNNDSHRRYCGASIVDHGKSRRAGQLADPLRALIRSNDDHRSRE